MPYVLPIGPPPTVEEVSTVVLEILAAIPDADTRQIAELRVLYGLTARQITERLSLTSSSDLFAEARRCVGSFIAERMAASSGRRVVILHGAAQIIHASLKSRGNL